MASVQRILYTAVIIVAVVAAGVLVLIKLHAHIPQSIFRKFVHIATGFVWVKLLHFLFPSCHPALALIPSMFLVFYLLMVVNKSVVAQSLGRDNKMYPFGIIEYIIGFALYPLASCDSHLGLALMCLLGGDGFAGIAAYFSNRNVKLFVNPNKSYIGSLLCFLGSLLYMWLYDKQLHYDIALLAMVAECLPLQQHDNAFIVISIFLYQLYPKYVTAFLVMCLAMSSFYTRNKFTSCGAVVGVLVIYAHWFLSLNAFVAVLSFGVLGTLSSSFKKYFIQRTRGKDNDSVSEQREGRSAYQVIDNSLISLIFSILYQITGNHAFEVAAVAASAECLADTFASDFGVSLGKQCYSPVFHKRLQYVGVNGGVSTVGTLFGILGCALSSLCYFVEYIQHKQLSYLSNFAICIACAQIGQFLDSLIGFYFQASWLNKEGLVKNDRSEDAINVGGYDIFTNGQVNIISSMCSGLAALLLKALMS